MKKHVPDPPPTLSLRPGLTHDQAVRIADQHLDSAIRALYLLPLQPMPSNQDLLSSAQLDLKIGKALLSVALAKSTMSVPID